MKISDKVFDTIVVIIFLFLFNLGVSSMCMLFLDIKFIECLYYSLINATWMPLVSSNLLVE